MTKTKGGARTAKKTKGKHKAKSAKKAAEVGTTPATGYFPAGYMGFTSEQMDQLEGTAAEYDKVYGKGGGEMWANKMKSFVNELVQNIEDQQK